MDDLRPPPRPADYKTVMDGLGGLVRIPLVGGLHAGRELFLDEPEVPDEIWTTPEREPFQWWPERLREVMAATQLGSDPAAPPQHYVLSIDAASREPSYTLAPSDGEPRG